MAQIYKVNYIFIDALAAKLTLLNCFRCSAVVCMFFNKHPLTRKKAQFECRIRVFMQFSVCLQSTNINHKGLQWTANEYAEERRICKDMISKNKCRYIKFCKQGLKSECADILHQSSLWLLRHTDEPQKGRHSCLWLMIPLCFEFFRCLVDVLQS